MQRKDEDMNMNANVRQKLKLSIMQNKNNIKNVLYLNYIPMETTAKVKSIAEPKEWN